MKRVNSVNAVLVMSALLVALLMAVSSCQKQEGPAEQAGKSIDNAAESIGEHVENAGEAIQNAAKGDKR